MSRNLKILGPKVILGLLVIILLSSLVYKRYREGEFIIEPKLEKLIAILLQDEGEIYELKKDIKTPIVSKSLQPSFIIKQNKKVSNLRVYLDNSEEDLLRSKFANVLIEYDEQSGDLKMRFNYILEPQSHEILLKYEYKDKKITDRYRFILILFDDFSSSISQSKLWGLAESAKLYNNWEFKEGKAVANPLPPEAKPDSVSSLFFIRRFQGDFFVQFDFVPKSNKVSFLPYLFQRKLNFVFGNNSDKDVILLNKPGVRGNFTFTPLETYHVRLIREKSRYKVFVTAEEEFSAKDLLINYEDKEPLKVSFDAFGFAIWENSGGVEIDNFYTANENISDFLDNYEKK